MEEPAKKLLDLPQELVEHIVVRLTLAHDIARASFGPGNASSSNTSSAGELLLPVADGAASAAAAPRAAVAFRRRPGATSTMPSVR